MHLVVLELTQEVVDFLCLGNEIGRTYERLPTECGWFAEMRQQILDIENATDIVDTVLIDGNARIIVLNDTFEYVGEGGVHVEHCHVLTTGHNLLGSLIAKSHDALQYVLFILDFILVGQFECLLQVIHTEHMTLLLHNLLSKNTRTNEY